MLIHVYVPHTAQLMYMYMYMSVIVMIHSTTNCKTCEYCHHRFIVTFTFLFPSLLDWTSSLCYMCIQEASASSSVHNYVHNVIVVMTTVVVNTTNRGKSCECSRFTTCFYSCSTYCTKITLVYTRVTENLDMQCRGSEMLSICNSLLDTRMPTIVWCTQSISYHMVWWVSIFVKSCQF